MQKLKNIWLLLSFCMISEGNYLHAQDSIHNKIQKEEQYKNSNRNASKTKSINSLKKSIDKSDDDAIAKNYENLGDVEFKQNNFQKANHNYSQALNLYKQQKNKGKISDINRKIGKAQEAQNKNKEAAVSYSKAEKSADNLQDQQLNSADVSRLNSAPNAPSASFEKQRNTYEDVAISHQTKGKPEAASEVYKDLAQMEIKNKNYEEATKTLEKAIVTTINPANKVEIKQQLAEVLAKDNKIAEAIALSHKILKDATDSNVIIVQLDQMIQLAAFYKQNNQADSVLFFLNKAYVLSVKNYMTKDAKNITDTLANFLSQSGQLKLSLDAYHRFNNDLDSLLTKDKSLIDENLMLATEQRIMELEKEKELQSEVINGKNNLNYVLIVSMIILFVLLGLIFRSLRNSKRKSKEIALQSLRREMNPHFIFNSLNSVNQFIAENNELAANKYLTAYSGLMRNVMEHSNKDFVKMRTEIDQLKKYLALEHLRFKDQFEYEIIVDEDIDEDVLYIPNMLLQPQLENAIWHGIRYKEAKGKLILHFEKKENNIIAIVKDNGIGIEKSKALKTKHQKSHQSIGINNTRQRIQLLNELYKTQIELSIQSDEMGTVVSLHFGKIKLQEN